MVTGKGIDVGEGFQVGTDRTGEIGAVASRRGMNGAKSQQEGNQ